MQAPSIVVLCYIEEESLSIFTVRDVHLVAEATRVQGDSFEIVLIDDGSSDETLEQFRTVERYEGDWFHVRWYSFSRNSGKEVSIFAGLEHATGDYVATMDAGMQDPPLLLPQMYERLISSDGSVDCVAVCRVTREGEPLIRSYFNRLFDCIINRISKTEVVGGTRGFRLMIRQMVTAVLLMREYNLLSKGIFSWVGFGTEWIPCVSVYCVAGESSWIFFSLLLYSIDGIVAFSTLPLSISSVMGLLLCLVALIGVIVIVVRALLIGDPVAGWPSLACIITLLGGIQLLCLGIMGQYLAKTYLEAKHRPLYIVRKEHEGSDTEKELHNHVAKD